MGGDFEPWRLGAWAAAHGTIPQSCLGSHVRFHEDGQRVRCLQEATTQGDFVFVSGPAGCEHTGDPSHSGGGTGIHFKAHALSTLGSM